MLALSSRHLTYQALGRHQWIDTQSACSCGWNPDGVDEPDHIAHQAHMIEEALTIYPDPDDPYGKLTPEQYIAELQSECTRLEGLMIAAQCGEDAD
jgi:hypothetical protein